MHRRRSMEQKPGTELDKHSQVHIQAHIQAQIVVQPSFTKAEEYSRDWFDCLGDARCQNGANLPERSFCIPHSSG